MLQIDGLYPCPNIWDKDNTNSGVEYLVIGRITFPRFQMSRGLSVNPTSVRVIMYLYKIGCLLVRGISFPAEQLFVIVIGNFLRKEVWEI